MTYKELLAELNKMSEDQLDLTVCFHDTINDEYYPATIEAADDETSEDHLGAPHGVPHPVIITTHWAVTPEQDHHERK